MKHSYTKDLTELDGVMAFLRVAERRNFRAAALDLGVSPSALSQTIRRLEARIGVALFARTTRKVGLTEAGERFAQHARPAMSEITAAFDGARELGTQASGLLRLNVPRAFAPFVVEHMMGAFCARYPQVQLEIFAEDRLVDIVDEGFDAGIRLGELVDKDMIAVRLTAAFRYAIVGAPAYFRTHERPRRPEDLARHRCIRSRRSTRAAIYRWEFEDRQREYDLAVSGPVIVNEPSLNVLSALQGVGLAYLPLPVAQPYIARGELESVLAKFMPKSPGLFLYYPSRRQSLPKLQAFVSFAKGLVKRIALDQRA